MAPPLLPRRWAPASSPIVRLERWAIGLLLLVALLLSALDQAFHFDPSPPVMDGRADAPFPAWPTSVETWRSFPTKFNNWFDGIAGLRRSFIRGNALEKVIFFHTTTSARVIIGKAGWLFYTGSNSEADHRGLIEVSQRDLAKMAETINQRQQLLAQRHIPYYVVIAPDKATIYPEYLPDQFRRGANRSRLDQELLYLQGKTTIPILDLRPALFQAKAVHRVYAKTDTHWNGYGAAIAAGAIVNLLREEFPAIPPLPQALIIRDQPDQHGGDNSAMLALRDIFREHAFTAELPQEDRGSLRREGRKATITTKAGPRLPRAVIFCDSFADALMPLMSGSFSRAFYQSSHADNKFDLDIINREHPDMVITEFVERYGPYNLLQTYTGQVEPFTGPATPPRR